MLTLVGLFGLRLNDRGEHLAAFFNKPDSITDGLDRTLLGNAEVYAWLNSRARSRRPRLRSTIAPRHPARKPPMTAARSALGARYRRATPPPGARRTGAVRTACRSSTSFGKMESRGQPRPWPPRAALLYQLSCGLNGPQTWSTVCRHDRRGWTGKHCRTRAFDRRRESGLES
jgi:hypothetical protein